MDFLEIEMGQGVQEGPVTIEFAGQGAGSRFALQLWKLRKADGEPVEAAPAQVEVEARVASGDNLAYTLQEDEAAELEHLALIIIRLDAYDSLDREGGYTVAISPIGH